MRRSVRSATWIAATLAGAALLPASAPAAAGSLVYAKDGNVHIAAPDGSGVTQITTDGGYAWPSQDDAGIIVAARQTAENGRNPRRLHRMNRSGALLHAPIVTVPVDNSFYIGPLAPKVSPDGALVAYHYFYTGPITDSAHPRIALTHSDRDTANGVITSTLGKYMTPSWTQDGRLLAFYAAERIFHVDIWSRDDSVQNWFGDDSAGALMTDGELSADGKRLAALGDAGELRIYAVSQLGLPPTLQCTLPASGGDINDPTWSPDGSTLAWEEPDGIHVAALPAAGGCDGAARPLVIPGGRTPDWGPAPAPRAGSGSGTGGGGGSGGTGTGDGSAGSGPAVTLTGVAKSAKLRAVLRQGLRLKATCANAACSLKAQLKIDAATARKLKLGRKTRVLAAGNANAKAGRKTTLRLRFTKATAAKLRKAKRFKATLSVTATSAAGRTVVQRAVTLR